MSSTRHQTLDNPKGTRQKKRNKNVENSTLGCDPPHMTENVENFQKKKLKSLKNLKKPK